MSGTKESNSNFPLEEGCATVTLIPLDKTLRLHVCCTIF